MTNDEAMKLARKLASFRYAYPAMEEDGRKLAQFILSGDMQREIENAAYRKAASIAASHVKRFNGLQIAAAIEALIQPPAQKDNGE